MRNLAPEQEMQMGEATTRAGDTLQSIGMRVQYQLDDAATKNAETQFLENALKITRGQNGYLNTVGQQAVDGYDSAAAALIKAKQDAEGTLSNSWQRMMFNRVAGQHLASLGAEIGDHKVQQVKVTSAQASKDRSDSLAQLATNTFGQKDANGNPTGDFEQYTRSAIAEAINAEAMPRQPCTECRAWAMRRRLWPRIRPPRSHRA
jgi:hypothetical protein